MEEKSGRIEATRRGTLAFGVRELPTGDRRSFVRLSFCRQDTEAPFKLSDHPLVPWWLRREWDLVYLCDLWAALCSLWLIRVKWECGGPSFDVRAEAQIARAVV
jgi:hypothetical protein